jgi:Fic family protein
MYRLRKLPYKKEYLSTEIYKYLSDANYSLGELKGYLDTTSYLNVILRLINVYEARNSSNIENVTATCNDIFIQSITHKKKDLKTSEVINHMRGINILYRDLLTKNRLTIEDINNVQKLLIPDSIGIRKLRGHKIYNKVTNEVLYIPPQNKNAILEYYQNVIDYINEEHTTYDPLIKMAIIHYQFECIHPYKDGNGRIGRIINSMSLVQSGRLNHPILNLSKYLYSTREEYFKLLEKCHNNINYLDEFIIYILKGINETTKFTITFMDQINRIMNNTKFELKNRVPKIYSDKLLIHLFRYPYTKNELLKTELNISRTTATKYLKLLEENGFVESLKYGKEVVYKNIELVNLFNFCN